MTTRAEISDWFDKGIAEKAKFMIVVVDTFDHEDYPVYCVDDAHCLREYKHYDGQNMQRIMEVYNLTFDKEWQLNQPRCKQMPQETAPQ